MNIGKLRTILHIRCIYAVCIIAFANPSLASVYSDTINQIKTIYNKSDTHEHKEFLNLEIIKDNRKFQQFLSEIVENNNGALQKIRGYYHPVGFIKVVIYKGDKGEQLRLHFWGKGGCKAVNQKFSDGWEPIHNHRWNFSSKVIKGGLNMKEYKDFDPRIRFNEIKEAQNTLNKLNKTYQIYDVSMVPTKRTKTDYRIINTGKFAVIGDEINKYVSGNNAYWIHHTTPHKVKSEKNTSTILLMDPAAKIFASEVFPKDEVFQDDIELRNLTDKEIQSYIREFLEDLKRGTK